MKWLEIIHLRTNPRYLETLLRDLAGPIKATEPDKDLVAIRIYRHPRLDTELIIQLHWKGDRAQTLESTLGLRLEKLLNEYGATNHSVWLEMMENKESPDPFRNPSLNDSGWEK